MEHEAADGGPTQDGRPKRKRKAPDSFADVQAVEAYERKSKQARHDDGAIAEALAIMQDEEDEKEDPGEVTEDDVPAEEDGGSDSEPDSEANPAPSAEQEPSDDSIWREELEEVDIGDFKGASEPEEVSLSVFCRFYPSIASCRVA